MVRPRKPTRQDVMRLDAIAKHLKIKSRYTESAFTEEVIAICLSRSAPVIDKLLPCSGEEIANGLGNHLCLTFEEVHSPRDVKKLENKYLKGKREIGFAQLRAELDQPGVDALLFERIHATERDPDRWVAVLNLLNSTAKAYWNRFHEISHRIAEPPQGMMPFRRHQFEASNPIESLMDAIAAELAFYAPVFQPIVVRFAKKHRLSFSVIEKIREEFAPTASLLSVVKATVKNWPAPAAAITAELRGRVRLPASDIALRITPQGYSPTAGDVDLHFFPNMRVPVSSPIFSAYQSGIHQEQLEKLSCWSTSQGKQLPSLEVFTSAQVIGEGVYGLISLTGE